MTETAAEPETQPEIPRTLFEFDKLPAPLRSSIWHHLRHVAEVHAHPAWHEGPYQAWRKLHAENTKLRELVRLYTNIAALSPHMTGGMSTRIAELRRELRLDGEG
jgi:hypothetical protein